MSAMFKLQTVSYSLLTSQVRKKLKLGLGKFKNVIANLDNISNALTLLELPTGTGYSCVQYAVPYDWLSSFLGSLLDKTVRLDYSLHVMASETSRVLSCIFWFLDRKLTHFACNLINYEP